MIDWAVTDSGEPEVGSFMAEIPDIVEARDSLIALSTRTLTRDGSTRGQAWHSMRQTLPLGLKDAPGWIACGLEAARQAAAHFSDPYLSKGCLTQLWANVLQPGATYLKHMHDGEWSLAFYLTRGSPIHFVSPLKESTIWTFRPEPGKVLFFRSDVPHWTDEEEGLRVSIAANIHGIERTRISRP